MHNARGLSLAEVSYYDKVCRLLKEDRKNKHAESVGRRRERVANAREVLQMADPHDTSLGRLCLNTMSHMMESLQIGTPQPIQNKQEERFRDGLRVLKISYQSSGEDPLYVSRPRSPFRGSPPGIEDREQFRKSCEGDGAGVESFTISGVGHCGSQNEPLAASPALSPGSHPESRLSGEPNLSLFEEEEPEIANIEILSPEQV